MIVAGVRVQPGRTSTIATGGSLACLAEIVHGHRARGIDIGDMIMTMFTRHEYFAWQLQLSMNHSNPHAQS